MTLALGRDRSGNFGQAAEARDRGSRRAGQEQADCLSERRTHDAAVGQFACAVVVEVVSGLVAQVMYAADR